MEINWPRWIFIPIHNDVCFTRRQQSRTLLAYKEAFLGLLYLSCMSGYKDNYSTCQYMSEGMKKDDEHTERNARNAPLSPRSSMTWS